MYTYIYICYMNGSNQFWTQWSRCPQQAKLKATESPTMNPGYQPPIQLGGPNQYVKGSWPQDQPEASNAFHTSRPRQIERATQALWLEGKKPSHPQNLAALSQCLSVIRNDHASGTVETWSSVTWWNHTGKKIFFSFFLVVTCLWLKSQLGLLGGRYLTWWLL